MKQKPSHQFYMQDFLSSPDVQMMNAEEVGCYSLLLFNLYVNGGEIENDAIALPMLCRGTKPSQKVMKKFYEDNGFLKHKRVDEELKKLAKFSKSQSNNARKRWTAAKEEAMPSNSHRNAKVYASAIPSQCPRGVSSSTSSSTSVLKKNIQKEKTPAEEMHDFIENASIGNFEPYLSQLIDSGVPAPYAQDQLKSFFLYWSEPTPSGRKKLWETKPTFEIRRRLATWFKNDSLWTSQKIKPSNSFSS
jgi:uncharacterized protein YdaU (DUF1376 family)